MEIASGKSADQFFRKIAQRKTILTFSAILAKRGNLNLDLNLDRHGYQIRKNSDFDVGARSFFCFDVYSYIAPVLHDMHACCWVLKCNENSNSLYDTDDGLLMLCRGVRMGAKMQ